MASPLSDDTHAASPVSASRRAEVLQELVEAASSAVNAQFDAFTTRLSDALLRASACSADPAEAKRCLESANLLKKNRYPFYYIVSERLVTVLEHEIQFTEDPSLGESAPLKQLSPDLEIDKKLTLIKAGRAIEREHSERLSTLGIRLAYLFGRHELEIQRNPFRPHTFLSAIHDAWCEFQPDAESHHLVFPQLQPDVFLDMASILHALNGTLVRRGILPRLADPYRSEAASPGQMTASEEGGGNTLARQLRRLFPNEAARTGTDRPLAGAFPTLLADDVLQAASSRKGLLGFLAGLRHCRADAALLLQIRQQAPQGLLTPADEHVFDLLIKIFAAVFRNENIPGEIRALIGSLQLPVLEAAVADREFFFSSEHPARRMIELLAHIGLGWDPEKRAGDPLHQAILRNIKRVQSDRRIPVFSDAVADLEAFIVKEESLSLDALSGPIAQALRQEKQQQASKSAQQDVALRVGTGEVVAFVEAFLEDKWVAVLTLAYSVQEKKPQAIQSALKTMDDLIWSVKPKITMDERKELLARLPAILEKLNQWLDLIKWDDAGRAKFFTELSECHASIVRAPLELSPQRQVELAVAAAQQAAERRMKKQASAKPEPAPDAFSEQVQKLERGTWMTFVRKDGSSFKAQLAWTSPMRSFYVFATRERQETLSLSADALAHALRSNRAQVMLAAGLVERALSEALGTDSANADMASIKPAA
ncbi:MAG TPA: DUF1631 family protein [Noviherbaspirillum sp.]|nr:DUF1631 family protein [Noviherbaspirillum sp.]